jgi:hypothetical protein
MRMASRGARLAERAAVLLCLMAITSGCAGRMDLMPNHFGFRPDEPPVVQEHMRDLTLACHEYGAYVTYAQQLQEAYHSRATQNRWWLYVAAITGLGAAAATGGLAAAGAAGVGTLALLGISGGFAAATFGTLNNDELAKMYTLSANSVDKGLQKADAYHKGVAQVPAAEAKIARLEKRRAAATDPAVQAKLDAAITRARAELKVAEAKAQAAMNGTPQCVDAAMVLRRDITRARTKLELMRTNNAAGALARAQEERKALDEIIAQFPAPAAGTTEDVEDTEP